MKCCVIAASFEVFKCHAVTPKRQKLQCFWTVVTTTVNTSVNYTVCLKVHWPELSSSYCCCWVSCKCAIIFDWQLSNHDSINETRWTLLILLNTQSFLISQNVSWSTLGALNFLWPLKGLIISTHNLHSAIRCQHKRILGPDLLVW